MSPEQANQEPIGVQSDIYALGVILYNLIVGRPPFCGADIAILAYKHRNVAPPRPSSFRPIDPRLEQLILDCLAKDPHERPQSVDVFRRRIKEIKEQPQTTTVGINASVDTLPPVRSDELNRNAQVRSQVLGKAGSEEPRERTRKSVGRHRRVQCGMVPGSGLVRFCLDAATSPAHGLRRLLGWPAFVALTCLLLGMGYGLYAMKRSPSLLLQETGSLPSDQPKVQVPAEPEPPASPSSLVTVTHEGGPSSKVEPHPSQTLGRGETISQAPRKPVKVKNPRPPPLKRPTAKRRAKLREKGPEAQENPSKSSLRVPRTKVKSKLRALTAGLLTVESSTASRSRSK